MANERYLQITIKYDPDMTEHVKAGKKHTDVRTGETIKKGTMCYKLRHRLDGKLYSVYISESTYQKLTP